METPVDRNKLYALSDYIIRYSVKNGIPVNVIKVQRLLYVAYAWYLAFFGKKTLFTETFEAWKFGPVCRTLHDRFKGQRDVRQPLTLSDCWYASPPETVIGRRERLHLDNVLNTYADMSADELEDMLRYETPWREARAGLAAQEDSSRPIPQELIYSYYKSRVHL